MRPSSILTGVLASFVIPFILLNIFGGLVGGVWLAFKGEWSAIFLGILIAFAGGFGVSLLLLPGFALAGVGIAYIEKNRWEIGVPLIFLNTIWTVVIILVWEIWIFRAFGRRVSSEGLVIPMWLWSYSAATGVWSWLASKENDGGSSATYAFAAQAAYIVLSVCSIALGWPIYDSIVAMAVPLVIPIIYGIFVAISIGNSQSNNFRI